MNKPVVLGPKIPDHWLDCSNCGVKEFVCRITPMYWRCMRCAAGYRMYRSGKLYKIVPAN